MARTPGEAADRVAAEVEARIERLATLAADAILHSLYAPQVVSPPKDQALDYWETLFFTPDGLVNQPGRDQAFKQLGGAEYKKVAYDLAARMRKEDRERAEEAPAPEEPLEQSAPVTAATPPPADLAVPALYGPRTQPAAA